MSWRRWGSVSRGPSRGGEDLDEGQVVLVCGGGCVVERDCGAGGWRLGVLPLHPVGVARWCEELVGEGLVGADGACRCVAPVGADPPDPATGSGRGQGGGRG